MVKKNKAFYIQIYIINRSPDGTEVLANMESGNMKVFKYHNDSFAYQKDIQGHFSGFNDFEWYPWMNESLPGSDLFVSVSKDLPVQLWSSGEGKVISSWIAKDHLDQVANCLSVSFSPDGQRVLCGGSDRMWLFDFNRPGNHVLSEYSSEKKSTSGLRGLISNLNFRFDNTGVFAAASFKGKIGIYDYRSIESPCCVFSAHRNGTSQVKFLADGWSLISAGRRDSSLKKWDLRMNSFIDPVAEFKLPEMNRTSQRIYFDTLDNKMITGSNQKLIEFDLESAEVLNSTVFSTFISSVSVRSSDALISTGTRNFECDEHDTSTIENGIYFNKHYY